MESDLKRSPVQNISIRVLAYSHVFRSSNPTLLIRGETSKSINVIVRNSKSWEWIRSLEVGAVYKFTRVIPSFLWKGTEDEIKVFEAGLSSELQRIKVDPRKPLDNSCYEAVSFEGKVMGVSLSQYGFIGLEDGSILCTSYVEPFVFLPNLQPNDQIKVLNVHSKYVNGKTYFVMCGASRLFLLSDSPIVEAKRFVVDFCSTTKFALEDLLKAVYLYTKLNKLLESLSSSFYSSVLSEHVQEVLYSVYPGLEEKRNPTSFKEVYKEFLISPHQCRVGKKGCLEDLEVLLPEEFHCLPLPLEVSGLLWAYKLVLKIGGEIMGTKNVALIGKLEVDLNTGYLSLNGGCKINFLVPEDKDFKMEIRKCIDKLVVIKGIHQVFERFMIHSNNKERFEEIRFNYIILYPGSICPIIKEKGLKDVALNVMISESNTSRTLKMKSYDSEPMIVDDEFLSQRFVLHHASSPVILQSRVMFFALVSLIRIGDSTCVQESDLFSRWCMLCIQGSMLQYFPFLCENRIYEISYPKSYGEHFFDRSSSVPELLAAKKILPHVQNGVLIPNKSILSGPFESSYLPLDSVVNKEIHSVNEALDASTNDVFHVKGIILSRNHQTPKYMSSKSDYGVGCGIPGGKNIILQLQDTSDSMTINIYIIKWTTKQYPLGLLPGAVICVKFVEKKCSSKGNSFLQSTCLTSIKVLECPAECYNRAICPSKIRRSYLKQEISQSLKSPFWTILSVDKVWDLEFVPACDKCGSAVIYGSFECKGCARYVKEPVINCWANISVQDGTGLAYLRVRNDLIRYFFDLEEEEWKEMKDLSLKKKLVYSSKKDAPLERLNCYSDGDQLAFKIFCQEVTSEKLWKVVCSKSKFSWQDGSECLQLFCLDVEEVDFDVSASLVKTSVLNS